MRCPECGLEHLPGSPVCGLNIRLQKAEACLADSELQMRRATTELKQLREEIAAIQGRTAPPSETSRGTSAAVGGAPIAIAPPRPVPPPPRFAVYEPSHPSAPPKPEKPEWEALIGGNWLLKVGILATVLGAAYFLKYAFDNRWIGDAGRVLLGGFAGLSFLGGGEHLRRKTYRLYGLTLSGGGVAILYLAVYAAFNFYALVPQLAAFLLMALVTTVCSLLAARCCSPTLAVIGVLGGLLTPYWLSTGQSQQIGLLTYVLILDAGAGVLARFRRWPFLNALTFVGTVALFDGWAVRFYSHAALWTTEVFLLIFACLFLALVSERGSTSRNKDLDSFLRAASAAIVAILFFFSSQALLAHSAWYYWVFLAVFDVVVLALTLKGPSAQVGAALLALNAVGILVWVMSSYQKTNWEVAWLGSTLLWFLFLAHGARRTMAPAPASVWDAATGFAAGVGYFTLSYHWLSDEYRGWMGLLAISLSLVHLLYARVVFRSSEAARLPALSSVAVSLTLVTAAVPIQLSREWITLGWAIEGASLTWLGFAVRAHRLRQAAIAVSGLGVAGLLLANVGTAAGFTPVLNSRFLIFLTTILAVYVMCWLYRRHQDRAAPWERPVLLCLLLAASFLTVIMVSQETWKHYSEQLRELQAAVRREEIAEDVSRRLTQVFGQKRQLALSLVWIMYSAAAVIVGMVRRFRPLRLFGIALFALAIIKVFLVDIWTLTQLHRIVSVVCLGALLLAVAFLYNRFRFREDAG